MKIADVSCPYCGNKASLVDSSVIYQRGHKHVWMCAPCGAYVGCHIDSPTFKPSGTLANYSLRKLRQVVHNLLDSKWNDRHSRYITYKWLAETAKIPRKKCHIALFNERRCNAVISLLIKSKDISFINDNGIRNDRSGEGFQ